MTWARRQFIADVEGRANAPPAARPDSPQQGVGVWRETRSGAGEEEEWREEEGVLIREDMQEAEGVLSRDGSKEAQVEPVGVAHLVRGGGGGRG